MRTRLTKDKKTGAASHNIRREISNDFKYNKKKLNHIKKVLHNINVSLGVLVSAMNEFSRVKGPDISPDGLLGGLGYIMPIREIKEGLSSSVKMLSDIGDSLADELTNPRWNAKDDKDIKDLLKEKEKVEEKVNEEISPDDIATPEIPEEEDSEEPLMEETIKEASAKLSDFVEDITPDEEYAVTGSVIKPIDHFVEAVKASLIRYRK